MEIKSYQFIIEAQTPIAHHSESIGNSAIAMRRKIRQPGGGFAQVPIITGDTMRHGLRESSSYALLDAAGLLDSGQLSEGALRLLFAGGMVTGRGDASVVKLDDFRVMCELIPPLSLLGGCTNNRVVPGRMQVDDALLICDETKHLIPAWAVEWADKRASLESCRSHVEEVQRVRMDPSLDPAKRRLLTDGAQTGAVKRLETSEKASAESDAIEKDDAKSSMMPRRFETIVAGSLFFWSVQATVFTDLDADTFDTMCATFLASARVGGKKGTGYGAIKPLVANEVQVLRPSEAHRSLDLAVGKGKLFREHVAARKDRIRECLTAVNA